MTVDRAARAALLLLALAGCQTEKTWSGAAGAGEQPRGAAAGSRIAETGRASLLTLRGLLLHPFHLVKVGGARTLPPGERLLGQGFGVTVRKIVREHGEPIAVTVTGHRLRMRDLEAPILSRFEGAELHDGKLQLAWVITPAAPVLSEPAEGARVVGRRDRLTRVTLPTRDGPRGYYLTREGWMRETDLAVPRPAARPGEVAPGELWIDIELRSQTLVVYDGDRPTFATLVSGGVGAPGSPFATPVGLHRITGKRLTTPMSNLDHRGVPSYYFYEEVPLAQFIGRVALHGVYWHEGFGQARSHGCINVSPSDAVRLFAMTRPSLPAGAVEVRAEGKGGTVVRVR